MLDDYINDLDVYAKGELYRLDGSISSDKSKGIAEGLLLAKQLFLERVLEENQN